MGFFRLYLSFIVAVHHLGAVARWPELGNKTFDPLMASERPLQLYVVFTFFFISGYFMPLALNHNYKYKTFSQGVRRFFINRFLRIFPLYWISIIIFPILYGFLTGKSHLFKLALQQPLMFLENFLLIGVNSSLVWGYTQNFNDVAWTLDLEVQYYLLLPFLAWHFKTRPRFSIAIIFIFLGSLIWTNLTSNYWMCFYKSIFCPGLAGWFIAGFLVYVLHAKMDVTETGKPYSIQFYLIFTAVIILGFELFPGTIGDVVLLGAHICIAMLLFKPHREKTFGRLDVLSGDLSYPVYVLHPFMIGPLYTKFYIPVLQDLQVIFLIYPFMTRNAGLNYLVQNMQN